MRSRQSSTARDHAAMSVDQAAPLVAVAGSQRVTLGSLLLAERLFRRRLRRVLRPTGAHLQPEDCRRESFTRWLAGESDRFCATLAVALMLPSSIWSA